MMEHFARLGHAEGQMRCLEGTLELEGTYIRFSKEAPNNQCE